MTETELQKLLKELLEEGENECTEFKGSDPIKFGEYISALSNEACLMNKDFGYLIFGINNKTKEIEGTTVNVGELNRAKIAAPLKPKINYSPHQFFYKTHKIILVKISRAQGEPTYYGGKAYARIVEDKTSLNNLSTGQIRKIYNSKIDWSAEIIEGATIDDLDEKAIKLAREKFKERAENKSYLTEIDLWSVKTFLDKAEFTIKGKITNCALILIGKRESRNLLKDSNASEITWELRDEQNFLTSYERFYPPFLLSISDAWSKIRNTKYLHPTNQLLNLEVLKYDNKTIIEALNNCIAHQDYFSNDRGIIIVEKSDQLIFENCGNFFEGKPEDYALGKINKAQNYRNPQLVAAMINLGMIDKMGSGIAAMYKAQRKRFFPMPDYSKSTAEKVVLQIYGKILNENFSRILMEQPDLDWTSAILLDHVQKAINITDDAAKHLRQKGFIEGRKPNYFISARAASMINKEDEYFENSGADNKQLQDWIIKRLEKFGESSRKQIDGHVWKFLGKKSTSQQQKKRVENLLQRMSREGLIKNIGNNRDSKWIKIGNK